MGYREAIDADLLRYTGHEFNDIGRTLSWSAFDSFLRYARPDSALVRELDPEVAAWSSVLKTNVILADIFDVLAMINANLVAIGRRKPSKKPKLYPRPSSRNSKNEQHFGSKALPKRELHRWIEEKRKEYARSSTGNN